MRLSTSLSLVLGVTLAGVSVHGHAVSEPADDAGQPQHPQAMAPVRIVGSSGTGGAQFHRPGSLATTTGGVLVADAGNARVQLLDRDGGFVWEAGGLGTDEGTFGRPSGVAASASLNYLVLDRLSRRVLEFHARGDYIGAVIDLKRADIVDRLGDIDPFGIAVDREGNAIISDQDGDRLLVFSSVWDFLYEVGGFGGDDQSFEDPLGVATSRGHVFVADSMNGRVQVLDTLGGFIDVWELPGGGRPVAVAVDDHGNVFVTDADNDRVVAFTADGQFACETGAHGRGLGSFRGPAGICVMGEHLVVADADNDRLQILQIRYGAL